MNGRCGPHQCWPVEEAEQEATVAPAPPQGFAERDWNVLQELAKGDDAQVGFQGIKRRLDLHPEALRRVLKRLQRDGLVTKDAIGYRLTEQGHGLVAGHAMPRVLQRPMPVASLLTPSHVTPQRVVQALARRWFDGLHWYGIAEGSGETALTWLTSDDQPVRVRVGLAGIRIEAAIGDAQPDDRLQAVAPLLAAIADLLRGTTPRDGPTGTVPEGERFAA